MYVLTGRIDDENDKKDFKNAKNTETTLQLQKCLGNEPTLKSEFPNACDGTDSYKKVVVEMQVKVLVSEAER